MKRIALLVILTLIAAPLSAHKLSSPNGRLSIEVKVQSKRPVYSITYAGKTVVAASTVGFDFAEGYFGEGVSLGKAVRRTFTDDYDLPVGKASHVHSVSNEMSILISETTGLKRKVNMVVRAFDDAVAFRYEFPEGDGRITIRNEVLDINPVGNPTLTALPLPGFINTHEGRYSIGKLAALEENKIMDMPLTFEFPGHVIMTVTEADLRDYAGMYLVRKGKQLTSRLSPRLDRPEFSVIASKPHKTPWRVFFVSDKAGDIIASNVLTTLCEPCATKDLSWLKPGKTTFPWWNDTCVPDTSFQAGNNFLTAKYYIDFAAESGLDYHSIYGYADMPWYFDDGPSFGWAGPNADLTRPVGQLDFSAVCRYAQSRGVDIHVWLNWRALYKDIDRVFDKFNEWGVKGMMVDFMDRDDQEMIQIQEDILRKAMEHKLFIQFHGASKPSGLVRTYPNEFTREGTLNYEVYKWDGLMLGPDHDISMPFTRMIAGAADYHLGGFRAVTAEEYVPRFHRPLVTCTRAHMLGMYIVLESYLQMVCDDPEAYRGQPGFKFLCGIPTNWDETIVPAAEVNQYAVIARRHGKDWYLGAINNSEARTLEIPLAFLGDGAFTAEICSDAPDSVENPNHILESQVDLTDRILTINLASGGGFAAKISPVK